MDVLSFEERDGLTIWGEAISAQARDKDWGGGGLVIHIMKDAPLEQGDVFIGFEDVTKLHALLNEMHERGYHE